MNYLKTSVDDVVVIEPQVFGDDRGFFMETFRVDEFRAKCCERVFVQENHSKSKHGILRGLHYQTENTQGKLVRVISGKVFDVVVDMRKASKTFGKSVGIELSAANKLQLWVPEGFAHGFYVMSESAEFVYKCTDYYSPKHEVSVCWNDPCLDIQWPLVDGKAPFLSEKDKSGMLFSNAPYFE